MTYKCLVIDDDETIAANTAEYFNIFDISTAYVTSFEDAVSFLDKNTVSLLLLDINLGDRSGFELCKEVRRRYDMPILFISARTSDDDVLTALNIGGDDYIKKPFTLNILLAKVKAILGRYERMTEAASAAPVKAVPAEPGRTGNTTELWIKDDMYLDTAAHNLRNNGKVISLKAMEYKMLLYFVSNRNRVITKDEFLKNVWEDEFVGEGTLSVHIRHLREKTERDPNSPDLIKTVWGVGYIMETGADQ